MTVNFKTENPSVSNFTQNHAWIPFMATWNSNLMTLESAQKAIVLFSQLAFDISLNVPQITGSKLKTKIIFPDREFTN